MRRIRTFSFSKTNKQGELEWSKRYGDNATEIGNDIIWQNGLVYLTGQTDGSSASNDIFLASLNTDGSATAADTCNLLDDLTVVEADWANPYDGQHNLSNSNLFAQLFYQHRWYADHRAGAGTDLCGTLLGLL